MRVYLVVVFLAAKASTVTEGGCGVDGGDQDEQGHDGGDAVGVGVVAEGGGDDAADAHRDAERDAGGEADVLGEVLLADDDEGGVGREHGKAHRQ